MIKKVKSKDGKEVFYVFGKVKHEEWPKGQKLFPNPKKDKL